MAYRSLRSEEYSARGVRKVTAGINELEEEVHQGSALSHPPIQPALLRKSHGITCSAASKRKPPLIAMTLLFAPTCESTNVTWRARVDRSGAPLTKGPTTPSRASRGRNNFKDNVFTFERHMCLRGTWRGAHRFLQTLWTLLVGRDRLRHIDRVRVKEMNALASALRFFEGPQSDL